MTALVAVATLGGCAYSAHTSQTSLPPQTPRPSQISQGDQRAIGQLAQIATRDAGVEAEAHASEVECWLPSQHALDEGGFRVICRVYFDEANTARYRDMICIGDVMSDPVADHCYQWAYYTEAPAFEDHRAFRSEL